MWSTRSSAGSGSPAREGDTAGVTGRWSWVGSATGLNGRGWPCPIHRRDRGRGAGTTPPVGDDDDQGDPEPGPGASSTSDATVRDAKHASVPLRRVRAGELREEFLYELKAGPAGGRLRRPSSAGNDATVTVGPASPSTPTRARARHGCPRCWPGASGRAVLGCV